QSSSRWDASWNQDWRGFCDRIFQRDTSGARVMEAALRLFAQALPEQRSYGRRSFGRQEIPVRLTFDNSRHGLGDMLALERPFPGERLKQDATESPHVRPLIESPPEQLLGAHVGNSADDYCASCVCGTDQSGRIRNASAPALAVAESESCGRSIIFANPKSRTFTRPSGVIWILDGLRSRCRMPFW